MQPASISIPFANRNAFIALDIDFALVLLVVGTSIDEDYASLSQAAKVTAHAIIITAAIATANFLKLLFIVFDFKLLTL